MTIQERSLISAYMIACLLCNSKSDFVKTKVTELGLYNIQQATEGEDLKSFKQFLQLPVESKFNRLSETWNEVNKILNEYKESQELINQIAMRFYSSFDFDDFYDEDGFILPWVREEFIKICGEEVPPVYKLHMLDNLVFIGNYYNEVIYVTKHCSRNIVDKNC